MPARIQVLLFDIGGVLASNGWDRFARRRATDEFGLDWDEFQDRHDLVSHDFETGRLDLSEYLDRVVFHRDRSFRRDEFTDFMKGQTTPISDSIAIAARLAESGRHLLATLNNESRALNEYRIQTLGLSKHFSIFFSSCYLGVAKPEPEIYRMALDVLQHPAEDCLFIDDRPLNLECAALNGMRTIHFTEASDLERDLNAAGVFDG